MNFTAYIHYSSICRLWIHCQMLQHFFYLTVSLVIRMVSLVNKTNTTKKRHLHNPNSKDGFVFFFSSVVTRLFLCEFSLLFVTSCFFKQKIPQNILIAITAHADLYLAFSSFHADTFMVSLAFLFVSPFLSIFIAFVYVLVCSFFFFIFWLMWFSQTK